MDHSYVYMLFIWICCLVCHVGCQGTFTFVNVPQNAAVIKNNNITLLCSATESGDQIAWQFIQYPSRTEGAAVNIALDEAISPGYENSYAIEPGTKNLVVMGATSEDAGIYICTIFLKNAKRYSELIVLESDPQCTANATLSDLRVDDVVQFSCQVNFTGLYAPTMYWQTSNGQSYETNVTTSTQAKYTLTLTTSISDNSGTVSCNTAFRAPPPGSYDPSWDVSAEFPQIMPVPDVFMSEPMNVKYGPMVTIMGGEASYFPGAVVVCSAEGNPLPTVQWIDNVTNTIIAEDDGNGIAEFTIVDEMEGQQEFKCYASNELQDVEESLSFLVIVTTAAPSTTAETTTVHVPAPVTGDEGLTAGEIVGIVIAVLVVIILILLLIYCCCFASRKAPSKTTKDKHSRLDGVDAVRHPPPQGMKPDVSYISDQGVGPPPYNPYAPPPNRNPEGFMYANLALDDTPRSRKPIQVYEPQEYGNDIRRV